MKRYEFSLLVHPDYEEALDKVTEKVKKLIADNGGSVIKEENDGKKRMQYTIKGQDFAVYYYMLVELPAEAPAKITGVLNISDEVLRSMIVSEDPRKLKYEAKQAARTKHDEDKEEE